MKALPVLVNFRWDDNNDRLPDGCCFWRHANFHQIVQSVIPTVAEWKQSERDIYFQGIHINPTDFPWYSETSNPILFMIV
jgi:hypothetical protein